MQKIIIASGPVVVKENKVLLDIQGEDSFWKFCGGKVRENESLSETAIRRANEELNINIELLDKDPFLLYKSKHDNGETFDVILVHFLADFTGDIVPANDVREWKWIPFNDLANENLAPNIIPTLKHFKFI